MLFGQHKKTALEEIYELQEQRERQANMMWFGSPTSPWEDRQNFRFTGDGRWGRFDSPRSHTSEWFGR